METFEKFVNILTLKQILELKIIGQDILPLKWKIQKKKQ